MKQPVEPAYILDKFFKENQDERKFYFDKFTKILEKEDVNGWDGDGGTYLDYMVESMMQWAYKLGLEDNKIAEAEIEEARRQNEIESGHGMINYGL